MAESCCRHQRSVDLDEFASRVRGFRVELLQIDPGTFKADGVQACFGGVLLGTARLGRALVQTWTSPVQSITIAVRTSRASSLWQGTSFGSSDLLIAGAGVETELVSQPGFGAATASFPDHEFRRAAKSAGLGSVVETTGCILLRLPTLQAAHEIRTVLRTLISQASADPSAARDPELERTKRNELLHRVVITASSGVPFDAPKHGAERLQVLAQALSAIRQRPADVLTISDLRRSTGASERTLHYAFAERYGLPPARFMKAYRLNGARRDLGRLASQEAKISDVANKWGFWHLGQFAKDYRRWFGELPSETSRRNKSEN
jgi:AraC family ethanolamine operon transcriptional activator